MPVPVFMLAWINNHIERCHSCRLEIRHLRFTTVALRRASIKSGQKTLDPSFADRVLARVRQDEAARARAAVNQRMAVTSIASLAFLIVAISSLGTLNALRAQWVQTHSVPAAPTEAHADQPPPYVEHDPFQVPPLAVDVQLDRPNLSQPPTVKSFTAAPSSMPPRQLALIPNYLPRIANDSEIASPVIHPSFAVGVTARDNVSAPTTPPVLVPSTYQQVDKETPPAIIQPENAQLTLSPTSPAPSAPSSDPQNQTDVVFVAGQASKPAGYQKPLYGVILPVSTSEKLSTDAVTPVSPLPTQKQVQPASSSNDNVH